MRLEPSLKKELLESIDFLIEYLFFPVKKESDKGRKIENKIAAKLTSVWDEKTKMAVEQAADLLAGLDHEPTPEDLKVILELLAAELGTRFAAMALEDILKLVVEAYRLGRSEAGRAAGLKVSWNLADAQAQKVLGEHAVYWIGNYYDKQLSDRIAGIVRDIAIDQGLGRVEAGRKLKEVLGDEFKRSDVYWQGLAAHVTTRSRVTGQMRSYREAGVEYYEILEMMDERTCPICREMNGKVFPVSDGLALSEAILGAKDPEDVKELAPWISSPDEIRGKTPQDLAAAGHALPPFHFYCRGTTVAHFGKYQVGVPDDSGRGEKVVLDEGDTETIAWETTGVFGDHIYMTRERIEHIVQRHGDAFLDEIAPTLGRPDVVVIDPRDDAAHIYYRHVRGLTDDDGKPAWLAVVLRQGYNKYVVTGYAEKKGTIQRSRGIQPTIVYQRVRKWLGLF